MTDTELLDAWERKIKREPLLLWDGAGSFASAKGSALGLSLVAGARTLREAIEAGCNDPAGKETR